jgi:hypothetical protein
MQITFSPRESWSFERDSIIVFARADGKPVQCVVSQDFLTAPRVEIPDEEKALTLFRARRSQIEGLLKKRIEAGAFNPAGEVVLRS